MTKVQTLAIKPILPNKEGQTKSNAPPAHTGSQLILQTCFLCFKTLPKNERPVLTSPLQCPSYSPPAYSSSLIPSIVSMLSLVGEMSPATGINNRVLCIFRIPDDLYVQHGAQPPNATLLDCYIKCLIV